MIDWVLFLVFVFILLLLPSQKENFPSRGMTPNIFNRTEDHQLTRGFDTPTKANKYDFLSKLSLFSQDRLVDPQYYFKVANKHSCDNIAKVDHRLPISSKNPAFTIVVELEVNGLKPMRSQWAKVFHCGNDDSTIRSPGLFVNDGQLVLTCTTTEDWNEKCWRSSDDLKPGSKYLLLITCERRRMTVHMGRGTSDLQLVKTVDLKGDPKLEKHFWVGRHPKEDRGIGITVTIYYLTGQPNIDQIKRYPNIEQFLHHNYNRADRDDALFVSDYGT